VAKFASSPMAAAISFNVSSRPGAASTRLDIAVFTYVCVAIESVLTAIVIVFENAYVVQYGLPGNGGYPVFGSPVLIQYCD
jgi:hypothetical protein